MCSSQPLTPQILRQLRRSAPLEESGVVCTQQDLFRKHICGLVNDTGAGKDQKRDWKSPWSLDPLKWYVQGLSSHTCQTSQQLSERDFLVNEHLPLCHLAKSLGAKVMWGRLCPPYVFPGPHAWQWTLKRQTNKCIADLTTSRQNAPADSGFQGRGGAFPCHFIERVREERRNWWHTR